MSTAFQAKFSSQQRDAAVAAYLDRGIASYADIKRMAEAGELTLHGVQLPPFDPSYATVRGWIRVEKNRRNKRVQTDPEDALKRLRGQLIDAASIGVDRFERQVKKGKPDWELARQIARALREIAAIPTPNERPVKPGQRDPATGQKQTGETTGGLAGAILSAARSNGGEAETAQGQPTHPPTQAENAGSGAATAERQSESGEQSEAGSLKRAPAQARARLLSTA